MLVSILHRATGVAMASAAVMIFLWWLVSAAAGDQAYSNFLYYVVAADPGDNGGRIVNILARIVGFGLTWVLFQHASSGVRHLLLDTGAGYELKTNKSWAVATMIVSTTLTVLVWLLILTRH
jgi:succinate dehydrogenase / fumarate reductase cytochrome b subunit